MENGGIPIFCWGENAYIGFMPPKYNVEVTIDNSESGR